MVGSLDFKSVFPSLALSVSDCALPTLASPTGGNAMEHSPVGKGNLAAPAGDSIVIVELTPPPARPTPEAMPKFRSHDHGGRWSTTLTPTILRLALPLYSPTAAAAPVLLLPTV